MGKATVTHGQASARETAFSGELELRFPFSEELRDALKDAIPPRYLHWDRSEKVWRVTEPHTQTAVDLLLEHFPRATVPEAYKRVMPMIVSNDGPPWVGKPWWDTGREQPVPPSSPALDDALVALMPAPAPEADELAPIVALVPCPKCHLPYPQALRVVAETSRTVAKREKSPPEMVSVCPTCNTLVIVSFHPALMPPPCQEKAAS